MYGFGKLPSSGNFGLEEALRCNLAKICIGSPVHMEESTGPIVTIFSGLAAV